MTRARLTEESRNRENASFLLREFLLGIMRWGEIEHPLKPGLEVKESGSFLLGKVAYPSALSVFNNLRRKLHSERLISDCLLPISS